MVEISKDAVLARLREVRGPDDDRDIVTRGMVSDVLVGDGRVMFSITVPAERAADYEAIRATADAAVREVPGVDDATVVLTAEKRGSASPQSSPAAGGERPPLGPRPAHGGPQRAAQTGPSKAGVPGVDAIIAVASGKGGVGKSTVAVNLALALKANGLSVGILDADIYGPSLPRLLNLKDRRPEVMSGRILRPLDAYGVKAMSIGFLVEEETPMIWRGPMVVSALSQMLREVDWQPLDVLVVDMPPGTGDAQLTMAQQVPLAGAVVVSTPQDLALVDARKGLNMFRRVDVPVLGIIENMSYFICPHCGQRSDIFGHGGAADEARRLGAPFLGEVPLDIDIRINSDAGTPVVIADPDGAHAGIFREIAGRVWQAVAEERESGGRPPPNIVIE